MPPTELSPEENLFLGLLVDLSERGERLVTREELDAEDFRESVYNMAVHHEFTAALPNVDRRKLTPRSTDRILRSLVAAGYLEHRPEGYRVTRAAEIRFPEPPKPITNQPIVIWADVIRLRP